jgi:TatD DNase family protein
MIDTHAHLDFPDFDEDREEVISRAFANGVKFIVNVGVGLERSRKSIEIAEAHENIFAAVGFHPQYFIEPEIHNTEQLSDSLKALAINRNVVAIGETGLDYFSHGNIPITEEQKENQKKGFVAQIELAKELNLPVIIHCRDAWDDLYKIIFAYQQLKFVLHCYSGEKKDTKKFLELPNISFSFSGNITYLKPEERAEKLSGAVKMVPLSRMMLDTDSPFLSPQKFRGKRNEPSYTRHIAEKIAEIRGISLAEVEKETDKNAISFFRLS